MAQAELVRKQRELEQEKLALGRQGIRLEEDLDWQKKQAELEAVRRRIREEEELNREIMAKAKEARQKKIEATLDQVAVQLRQMIYEVTVDALASIEKNAKKGGSQFLLGRTSIALRNLVEQVRLLNFTDDTEIERCIQAIEEVAVDREAGDRDIGQIERTLRQIGIITRGELLSLGQAPRSARALEIPDRIDETAVRRARRELQGGGEEVATLPLRQPRRRGADEEVKTSL